MTQSGSFDQDEHYYLDTEHDFGYVIELGNAGRIPGPDRRYPALTARPLGPSRLPGSAASGATLAVANARRPNLRSAARSFGSHPEAPFMTDRRKFIGKAAAGDRGCRGHRRLDLPQARASRRACPRSSGG